jgi:hypothetical protein
MAKGRLGGRRGHLCPFCSHVPVPIFGFLLITTGALKGPMNLESSRPGSTLDRDSPALNFHSSKKNARMSFFVEMYYQAFFICLIIQQIPLSTCMLQALSYVLEFSSEQDRMLSPHRQGRKRDR